MPQRSAGILLYRLIDSGKAEVLLVHPGGPFWAKKDDGAWSIPKGVIDPDEDALQAAKREFAEETGQMPVGDTQALGDFKYTSGKVVTAFAIEGDFDLVEFQSNSFTMEWPPKSGKSAEFPEADRAQWFGVEEARRKIIKGQVGIIDAVAAHLSKDERS